MLGIRTKLLPRLSRAWHTAQLPAALKQPRRLAELGGGSWTRNQQYFHCVYAFDHFVPAAVREHRRYFATGGRGFGEDAFHAMWHLIFVERRPLTALEIGVYRGQTVTLWKLLARELGFECEVSCISPFTPSGDSVSRYGEQIDYYTDVLANHRHFELPAPRMCRHFSTAPEAKAFAAERAWDVVYIDGNHDYDVARQDWEMCTAALAPGGLVVLDDAALGTDYRPPRFASAGHPGPSRLAAEVLNEGFQEVLSVGHNRVFQKRQR